MVGEGIADTVEAGKATGIAIGGRVEGLGDRLSAGRTRRCTGMHVSEQRQYSACKARLNTEQHKVLVVVKVVMAPLQGKET